MKITSTHQPSIPLAKSPTKCLLERSYLTFRHLLSEFRTFVPQFLYAHVPKHKYPDTTLQGFGATMQTKNLLAFIFQLPTQLQFQVGFTAKIFV